MPTGLGGIPKSSLTFPSVGHWATGLALKREKVELRGYVSTELDEVPSDSPGFATQAQMSLIWQNRPLGVILRYPAS
jgi:hypothetical protein